jgi:CO dehydrogenase maturation factor
MKLAISGKGGTGKSTIAGILAHYFSRDGYRVLAVDSDPDANLASAIGIPRGEASAITPVSEQRRLIKERTGANPRQFGQLFKLNPTVDDIPDRFSIEFRGIKLLVMGAVRKGESGCACPENVLLRNLLSEIILHRDEVVVIDLEAGIEHLGRATAKSVDRMLIVVEPGSRSIETAGTIMNLGADIGIQDFAVIANKIQNEEQRAWISGQFPENLLLGTISYHEIIRDCDILGKPLIDSLDGALKEEFDSIYRSLIERLRAGRDGQ